MQVGYNAVSGALIDGGYDEGDNAREKLWAYADNVLPRKFTSSPDTLLFLEVC